jgi:putative Holliday junction resolvase
VRQGVRIGVDLGTVRIGVAACDPTGLLATPLETVQRGRGDLDRIAEIVAEREAIEVVLGLPLSLSGAEGPSASSIRDYSVTLAVRVAPVHVRLVDERLSTVAAARGLRSAGVAGRRARTVVDQVAAASILQAALDIERSLGAPPGATVQVEP